tara:strand:- start:497 stop:9928 length:9432 start_codon:yes stop_codon:yes gene_type:complete
MDEKQKKLVQGWLNAGKTLPWIMSELKIAGMEFDREELDGLVGEKKKTSEIAGFGLDPQKSQTSVSGGSGSEDESSDSRPYFGPVSESEQGRLESVEDVKRDEVEAQALKASEDFMKVDPVTMFIKPAWNWFKEQVDPNYINSEEFENSGVNLIEIAGNVRNQANTISGADINKELKNNQEYLKELQEVREKFAVGNEYTRTGKGEAQNVGMLLQTGQYESAEAYRDEVLISTEETLEKEVAKVRSKYAEKEYVKLVKEIGDGVMSQLPPEIKNNPEALEDISNEIYRLTGNGGGVPLNLDLHGSGVVNQQPFLVDLVDSFAGGVESIIGGIADAAVGSIIEATQGTEAAKDWAKLEQKRDWANGGGEQLAGSGFVDLFSEGDIWNGSHVLLSNVSGAIPSVAVAVGTGGYGLLALGVSGAGAANKEALTNPEFSGLGRLQYTLASGTADAIAGKTSSWVFKRALKYATKEGAKIGFKQALKGGAKPINDYLKFQAYKYLPNISTNAIEEWGVAVMTDYAKVTGQGNQWTMDRIFRPEVVEQAIVGGFIGAGTTASASLITRSNMLAQRNAETAKEVAALENKAAQLDEQALSSTSTAEAAKLRIQAQSARDRAAEVKAARAKFYKVVMLRNQEAFDRYIELDQQIYDIAGQIDKNESSPELRKELEADLEALIDTRMKLDAGFAQDNMDLSNAERATIMRDSGEAHLNTIKEDLAAARQVLKEKQSKKRPNKKGIAAAEQRVKDLTNARRRFQRLQKKYDSLYDQLENLDPIKDQDQYDSIEAQIDGVIEKAAEVTGLTVETFGGLSAGEYLVVQDQINERYLSQWTQDNIENMENSTLSREAIETILTGDNFAMLTGENPNAVATGNKNNQRYNDRAKEWMASRGLKFHEIIGRYGAGERSFLVEGMTRDQAAEFAKTFGQESVAHKDGLVLADGSLQKFDGNGPSFIDAIDGDYFSALKDSEGNVTAFQFGLTEQYEDSEGNKITKEEYNKRIEDNKQSVEDIEAEIAKEKREGRGPGQEITQQTDGDGYVSIPRVGKSANVTEATPGIENADEARVVNNLQKLLDSMGLGMEIRIITDAGFAQSIGLGTDGGRFFKNEGILYVNPFAVRANMIVEEAGQRGQRRKMKTKSFGETLMEEVMHSTVLGPALNRFYIENKAKAKKLEADLLGIAGRSGIEGFKERLIQKRLSYEANRKPADVVFEEVVIEFMSTLAANPDISLSLLDKIRLSLNGMLTSVHGKSNMKGLTIQNSAQLIQIAQKFADAQAKGETFRLDLVGTEDQDDQDRQSARMVLPNRIPASEDGKVRVKMQETFYKYDIGFKKDIGSEEIVKEFNDVWHFANWWRKATKNGEDQHFFGFETESGDPIDVNRIASWGNRSSARVMPLDKRINDTVFRAIDQGIISRVVGQRIRKRLESLSRRMNYEARHSGEDSDKYEGYKDQMRTFESYVEDLIDREAKDLGKEFDPGESEARSSARLQEYIMESGKMGAMDFKKLKSTLKALTGEDPVNRVMAHDLIRKYIYDNLAHMNPSERLDIIIGSYLGPEGKAKIDKFFGKENPVNFFDNYNKEVDERIETLINQGRLVGNPADLKMRLNFIMAFTSAQSNAQRNVDAAFSILEYANKRRNQMPAGHIVPIEIIRAIEGKGTVEGFDRNSISPRGRVGAASQLRKLNALLSGKQVKMPTKYGEMQLNKHVEDYGSFTLEDGSVNWESLLRLMLTQYGEGSSRVRKGKREYYDPLTGEFIQESIQWMGQEMFSDKLGTWAMNLSHGSYPDLKAGRGDQVFGLMDPVTVDTHVINSMALIIGKSYDAQAIMMQNLARLYNYMNGTDLTPRQLGLETAERTIAGRKIIEEANELISYRQKQGFDVNTLSRYKADAVSPQVNLTVSEKRLAAALIEQIATKYDITPAQVGQLLFADRQVQNSDYLAMNWSDFNLFNSEQYNPAKKEKYSTYAAAIKESAPEAIPSSLSEATPDMETRSSQRLIPFPEDSQQATESPLYRVRDAAEALMFRGVPLSDEAVAEALSTDTTSRRIMAKDIKISDGQKVGVRLNLNVMKNRGVPVQTMHDKTANGEALRYSAAVMVKNPTLFVNQNARRKILTFQENKFPMASVNGEFMSDKLSQMDYNGVKAFFNPFKHNVFVDASGRPIKSADEATIVGSTVFLRGNIEYYDFSDPILSEGRSENPEAREKRIKRGPKYDKALKRFEGYSKAQGIEFADSQELMSAYDNMPIRSQVALNESEVAENMADAQTRASSRIVMRQTAGRSARFYQGETRRQIVNNPNNYFTPQVIKDLKQKLSQKSDSELIDIMTDDGLGRLSQRNDDLGVLASAEMINRAVARGDMDAIPDLIEEAAAMGTTAGRILRHLRELKGSTPKGIEQIIIKAVERKGNTLSDEQKSRLQKMAADMFRVGNEHEALMKRAIAGEDVEVELKAKTKEVKEAERALETFANATIERGWGEIGGLLIQGNLLTPMSQITNVGANMVNALGKVAVDAIALPIERMVNMFGIDSPMKRNYSINAYLHGMRRFGAGFVEALDQIYTGQEADVTEWRMTRGFAPFRSLMSAMGKGDLPLGPDGKAGLNTRAKLFVQGTLGIPAEVMFRFLSLGDTPFRRYVEGIELYQMGKNQGLEGDALKNFLKFPNKKAREMAEAEGKKLTYQEETIASRTADDFVKFVERMTARFFNWIPGTDGTAMARFLIRSNIPYRRTPANILYDTLTFATPYVAVPRMMAELKNGDARGASQTLAKSMIGGMATQVTLMMIREGLISGAIEWNEDEEKNIAYDQFPPNSINISALKRWMGGGDPAKQEDDEFISYMKLGILGTVMGSVVKGVDRTELKKRDYSGDQWVTHVIQDSFGIQAFSSIAHMMDQSFVQGMNNLVQVISTGDERTWENWLGTTFQAMSATALPNTLSAFYRAERDYLPDTRITKDMSFAERVMKKFEYTIKSRTFGLGELPIRRNWKGEKIEQTPRGTNGIAYQLFDITKSRQGEADAVSNEIWRLYEQTEDLTTVCGTPGYVQKKKLNVPNVRAKHIKMLEEEGLNYTWVNDQEFMADRLYLNTDQLNRLMEASGKERYAEVEQFMETEEYNAMDDEAKVEALNDINDNYNSAIEIHDGKFRNHTKVLFEIMQEVYDGERQ